MNTRDKQNASHADAQYAACYAQPHSSKEGFKIPPKAKYKVKDYEDDFSNKEIVIQQAVYKDREGKKQKRLLLAYLLNSDQQKRKQSHHVMEMIEFQRRGAKSGKCIDQSASNLRPSALLGHYAEILIRREAGNHIL